MHTKTISTEKPLHRTVLNTCFLHKKHLTQRNLYTQTAHKSFYRPTFLYATIYPNNNYTAFFFSHGNLYAEKHIHNSFYRQTVFTQKIFRTEDLRQGFTHNIFYIQTLLHTDVFTQTQIAHRNLCTQHAFTHNQFLHREALLPLLDHLPFVFPLSIFFCGCSNRC